MRPWDSHFLVDEAQFTMTETVTCLLVEKNEAGQVTAGVTQRTVDDLPPGDVLVRVAYSSLNYKDAMAIQGNPGVARRLPHVPGIDAAGTVVESRDPRFTPGQEVIVTSYELGAGQWGGYATHVRVPADWVVPLPAGLSLRESMILGTAGFTAALGVWLLQKHDIEPGSGEILVTGATGGVGSLAICILARLGYRVVAVSGKRELHDQLQSWGAAEVLGRDALADASNRPLLSGRWAGVIDTVGGQPLANLLKAVKPWGCVAACGLVAGAELPTTVYPFILRGVTLTGIDSATCPMPLRQSLWQRLATDWKPPQLESLAHEVTLEQLSGVAAEILQGKVVGRTLVVPRPM